MPSSPRHSVNRRRCGTTKPSTFKESEMSQFDDSGYKTFIAAGAISKYSRVKISAAETVDVAGITDREIGTATNQAFAAGDRVTVKLRSAAGHPQDDRGRGDHGRALCLHGSVGKVLRQRIDRLYLRPCHGSGRSERRHHRSAVWQPRRYGDLASPTECSGAADHRPRRAGTFTTYQFL
jgi:hypothetical protein